MSMKFFKEAVEVAKLMQHPDVLDHDIIGSALYMDTAADLDVLVLFKDRPAVKRPLTVMGEGTGLDATDPLFDNLEATLHEDEITGSGFLGYGRWMFGSDWCLCGVEYSDQDDTWGAIRKGSINLIMTNDEGWYKRSVTASRVCEALKLTNKDDRIVVYRVIRDGYDAESANARRDGSK
jgi:hypothetical protein